MRIIAGKFKGRRIETLDSKNLRPTMAMAKEAVFNILSHGQFVNDDGKDALQDSVVLDLFCGCGALAIEALSRGAAHVTFVDIEQDHLEIARRNVRNLGELDKASFIRTDSATPPPARRQVDLVFLDPPYDSGLAKVALQNLVRAKWLKEGAIIVLETSRKDDTEIGKSFTEILLRSYGNAKIRILKFNNQQ